MALTSMPLGNFILPELNAKAADEPTPESYFTYEVKNGEAIIRDCDKSVADVVIPETLGGYPVTTIDMGAFSGYYYALTSLFIPRTVKIIRNRTFDAYEGTLKFITVDSENPWYCNDENGVLFDKRKTVLVQYPAGREADSYIVPDSVEYIHSDAFYKCKTIKNVTLPEGVTEIGTDAFYECSFLENINFPYGLEKIYDGAFCACTDLKSITIPESVVEIYGLAFWNCDSLESVYIPKSVVSKGIISAFRSCDSLQFITVDSENPNYSSDENGVVFNKDKTVLYQYPCGRENDSYTVPNGVTEIYYSSFYECNTIKNVVLPDSVTNIDDSAFAYCKNLTSISISDSVKNIGEGAFVGCESLTDITIPEGVVSIGHQAFQGCYSLTSVEIPDSVTDLGKWAFAHCYKLEKAVIGDGVTSLKSVFGACKSLTDVTIGKNVTVLDGEFGACESLKKIVIPENVCQITGRSFGTYIRDLQVEVLNPNVDYTGCETSIYARGTLFCHYGSTTEAFVAANPDLKFDHLRPYPVKETVEPSCFEDGKIVYDCDECSFNKEEAIPAIGSHDHVLTETVAPSCGVEGKNVYSCSRCGDTYEEAIPALEHSYSLTETVEPSCTADGKKVYTCSNCGDTYEEIIPALGDHEYIISETVNSTCTQDGKKVYTCSNCGDTYEESIPATGHSFGEWVVETEPTIFYEGLKKRTCSVCGFEETEAIPKLTSNDKVDPDSGVHIIFPDHSIEGEFHFEANHLNNADLYERIQELGYERVEVFDVNLYRENGDKIQPNGKVLIKVPAPEGFDSKNCSAYYIPASGKPQRIQSYYQDGYIYFETDHFSYYAIVDESSTIPCFKVTNNGSATDSEKAINVFVSPFKQYKQVSTVLGVQTNSDAQIKNVRYELANWSVNNPEANITDNGDGTATITPNGRGVGARSVWVKITAEDVNGNTFSRTVKVRFYKWNWQMQ